MIYITKFLQFVNENPWLNILFISLTLISIILSIWFYFKSIKTRKPSYCTRTFNLVRDKINEIDSVDIMYQGSKVNNLSISKIAIWNGGKETIDQTDIAKNDKFRLEMLSNATILDFKIIYEKNRANGFKLTKKSEHSIDIDFDYFDFKEGLIIQLYHTGSIDSDIILRGSFKGSKQIFRNDKSSKIPPKILHKTLPSKTIGRRLSRKILGIFTFVIPILFFTTFLIGNDFENDPGELGIWTKLLIICIITIPYWWLGVKLLKRKVPKGFNLFEDEF